MPASSLSPTCRWCSSAHGAPSTLLRAIVNPMSGPVSPMLAGVGIVGALLVAGVAWHECLLLASAAVAGHRVSLWRIREAEPVDGWRLGTDCLFTGAAGLLAVAALAAGLLLAVAGVWMPDHANSASVPTMAATAGTALAAIHSDWRRMSGEVAVWCLVVTAAVVADQGTAVGRDWVPCIVSGALLLYVAQSSWALAREGSAFAGHG